MAARAGLLTPWVNLHNRVIISALGFCPWVEGFMRALGFGFLIVWLFASAPLAITLADAVQAPDTTQSPTQPVPDDDDLLNLQD
jgi:hypothetical protein